MRGGRAARGAGGRGRRRRAVDVPTTLSARDGPRTSTQAALGRALLDLSRIEGVAERLVTVSPDVSISTNLGGFINKVGVWGLEEETVYDAMEDSPLRWRVGPRGQHIEMGIAEMNLVLLLGQLGLSWDVQGETVFPIGTLYDPFVMRALEGIVYSVYSGLAFHPRGHAVGDLAVARRRRAPVDQHGGDRDRDAVAHVRGAVLCARVRVAAAGRARAAAGARRAAATYLRLSTTPIAQEPFAAFVARVGDEEARADVVAGGFRLREPGGPADDRVILAGCGAIMPELLRAADQLAEDEGIEATVLCLSSPDLLYRGWRAARVRPLRDGEPAGIEPSRQPDHARRTRGAGRDGDRRREPRAGLARERARDAVRAARGGRVRADREPARALRGVRDRRGGSHDGGAGRARALASTHRVDSPQENALTRWRKASGSSTWVRYSIEIQACRMLLFYVRLMHACSRLSRGVGASARLAITSDP